MTSFESISFCLCFSRESLFCFRCVCVGMGVGVGVEDSVSSAETIN